MSWKKYMQKIIIIVKVDSTRVESLLDDLFYDSLFSEFLYLLFQPKA